MSRDSGLARQDSNLALAGKPLEHARYMRDAFIVQTNVCDSCEEALGKYITR
jgi:hypothetical protein